MHSGKKLVERREQLDDGSESSLFATCITGGEASSPARLLERKYIAAFTAFLLDFRPIAALEYQSFSQFFEVNCHAFEPTHSTSDEHQQPRCVYQVSPPPSCSLQRHQRKEL